MRLALTLAALVIAAGPAVAACTTHPMSEGKQAYTSALLRRMRPLGVQDIDFAEPTSSGDHYVALGAAFSLFLKSEGTALKEVGLVLSEPATRPETDKLLAAAAFTLSRLSGTPEATVRRQLITDSANHASGSWNETFGPAAAVFTRTDGGTVIKAGLLSCD